MVLAHEFTRLARPVIATLPSRLICECLAYQTYYTDFGTRFADLDSRHQDRRDGSVVALVIFISPGLSPIHLYSTHFRTRAKTVTIPFFLISTGSSAASSFVHWERCSTHCRSADVMIAACRVVGAGAASFFPFARCNFAKPPSSHPTTTIITACLILLFRKSPPNIYFACQSLGDPE